MTNPENNKPPEPRQQAHHQYKSGFISIVGPPNVGKSTFLNRALGEKISITSPKPQTTRNRILGVLHRPSAQLIFLDTPGIHKATGPLRTRMVDVALGAMAQVDCILVMVDAVHPDPRSEEILIRHLEKSRTPAILSLNKIDRIEKPALLSIIGKWSQLHVFKAVVPISAKKGTQVDRLIETLENQLPVGPPYFPAETITDVPERFIAAEMIREKIYRLTGQEIPYATAVTIDSFSEDGKKALVLIHATIHVEQESQKGIIIGKKGSKLKSIGEAARIEIERMVGRRVFLQLFVRVQKNWSRDTKALRKLGY
ncbi:MAG: GTPase Era [Desulfobacterales bacterium]|nr:GTPase Era [Desulfobacterales bacterium]